MGDGGADGGEKGKARFADLVALPDDEIPLRAAGLLGTWADSGIIISFVSR